VVAKLDRLSRSMLDFTAVMAQAQKQGWALVALDCAVDTTTPAGEAMANVLATFAQFERRLIGQRTPRGSEGATSQPRETTASQSLLLRLLRLPLLLQRLLSRLLLHALLRVLVLARHALTSC
jgi:DNA invertase Pin-like site-specific DNA recombinase